MSLDGYFFHQVSSFRLLKGLILTANSIAENDTGSVFIEMDHGVENMNVFFGCDEKTLESIKPIKANEFEFSVGGNFLDWLYPNEKNSDLKPMQLEDFVKIFEGVDPGKGDEINQQLRKFGLDENKSRFTMFF